MRFSCKRRLDQRTVRYDQEIDSLIMDLFLPLQPNLALLSSLPKGYFVFDECPDVVTPTLGMEVGVTYKFVQVCVQKAVALSVSDYVLTSISIII